MFGLIFRFILCLFPRRTNLIAENIALRHQLLVLERTAGKPKLKQRDRILWVWLSHVWTNWQSGLVIVQPNTVVKWHRQGFKLYWRWKSRGRRPGRPSISLEVRELIRQMSRDNPTWGVPHIQDELALLGVHVAESTIRKYRVRSQVPGPQTWKTFVRNHIPEIAAIDFFVVHTATYRLLYCFVVLQLDRRRVAHFDVTAHPTAQWTAQQLNEAFPFGETPRFIIRDRDGIFGEDVQNRLKVLGIEEVVTAARSPWQNGYVERLIGSVRRECLDHVIVLNQRHLVRLLNEYFEYYHESRTHQSLDGNSPAAREVELPERGRVVAEAVLSGLHHRYRRAA